MISRSWLLVAAAAASVSISIPNLRADEPATQDTAKEISALRARLDQLEAQQKESDRKRQEAERKLQEKVTSDQLGTEATKRDQFISEGDFTAGYIDGRFIIQDAEKKFVLRPWMHFQFREATVDLNNIQCNAGRGRYDEWDTGFEVRRAKFGVDGNLFSPDFTYFFNWATVRTASNATVSGATPSKAGGTVTVSNNLGGVPILEEAWVKWRIPQTDFYIKAGQIHDPLLHEEYIGSRYQQATEFSLTCSYFTNKDAFTEGATVIWDPDSVARAEMGVNHGMRSANTNFFSYPDNGSITQFDYGVAGRFEYKVMGRWKDYGQIGAVGTKEQLLVFGVGADYSERGHSGQTVAVFDGMYADPSGLNFYGGCCRPLHHT